MKKSTLQQIIREEIHSVLNIIPEKTFRVFGGIHSDAQLDALDKQLKLYDNARLMQDYVKQLELKGYNKKTHKEHPHYIWAVDRLKWLNGKL